MPSWTYGGKFVPSSPMGDVENSVPWEVFNDQLLSELLAGNRDAVQALKMLWRVAHVYDDIIDHDRLFSEESVHLMMRIAMIDLPMNAFYQQWGSVLRPVILTGILNWIAANEMQRSKNPEELRVAHVLRYSICDVVLLMMELTGGAEHAMANARRARLMFQDDTWSYYEKEHT